MQIEKESSNKLDKIGIYKIINLINNKVYVGSTQKSFISRYKSHYEKLRINKHIGYLHLQNAVNKYGIENFKFEILEECEKEQCIEKETFWIKYYNSTNKEKGYNINDNPANSPFTIKEVVEKAAITRKEGYKNGRNIPNSGTFKKGVEVWNKGLKYDSTNHLKVPKKVKGDRSNFIKTIKEKQIPIEVYNIDNKFIKEYRYVEDIILDSKNEEKILCNEMILWNTNGRNGYNPFILFSCNIHKSCNYGKPYKGLIFKYKNHNVHIKQEELLENPTLERQKEDNQQPSLIRNNFEGSTTNTRILTSNVEDSNGNTSILPLKKIVLNFNKTKLF
jgi:group I intron endonuclease